MTRHLVPAAVLAAAAVGARFGWTTRTRVARSQLNALHVRAATRPATFTPAERDAVIARVTTAALADLTATLRAAA